MKKEILAASAVVGLAALIGLAHDYSYAVVGHPNRKYLWILGRKPQMDEMTYNYLALLAAYKGFDIRNLVRTDQSCG